VRDSVRRGRTAVAVIIPEGFGDAAGGAFFGSSEKPQLEMLYDPSRTTELAMVRGVLTQHVMEAVSREMLGGPQGRGYLEQRLRELEGSTKGAQEQALLRMLRSVQEFYTQRAVPESGRQGFTMPYSVREEAMTAGSNVAYNGYAHAFAGMGVQFLLFAMANLGIDMLLERQRGL
jgi:ABC-2 type transport system permease protein